MQKICPQCHVDFKITNEDLDFYAKISAVFNGKTCPLPPPTLCPDCRMQRRMAFRNERKLHKRKCDLSGADILSIYPSESLYKIYDQKIWWSDQWDPLDFGQDFDFNLPFFEQFQKLLLKVPRASLQNHNNENSDYCNDTENLKNCYLCFNSANSQDCHYCTTGGFNSRDSLDLFWSLTCELCYECVKVTNGYHSFWCFNGSSLNDCYFCEDCQSCKNCFGCIGLRQKEYCLYNQQLTKEEYEEFRKKFQFTYTNIEAEKQKLKALRLKVPCKNLMIQNSEDCLGDYILNSKNCTECFDLIYSQNGKFIWDGMVNNSYDCFNSGKDTNFTYECVATYVANNVKFSNKCSESSDLMYCDYCFQSGYLFGCVGLKHKKYCILNRQYTREEYEKLVPKIIEHMQKTQEWGEFFPVQLSPFGYNDTMAAEYFPLERENAMARGFNWNDYNKPQITGFKSIPALELPNTIQEVSDDITEAAIQCEKDQKLFKLIPQELNFYRKESIALPRLCPDCRHYARKALMNPRKIYTRNCAKCNKEMQTTYAPNRPEIVYCEVCYLKKIY